MTYLEAVLEAFARKHPHESYDLTVYLFRCKVCAEAVIHWDMSYVTYLEGDAGGDRSLPLKPLVTEIKDRLRALRPVPS